MKIEDVRIGLDKFLSANEISASALSRAIGVSPSQMTQFRKGVYKGDNEALAIKIAKYMQSYNKKGESRSEFFLSSDAKMALFTIEDAVNDKEIALIYGEAGTGKSSVLARFEKSKSNVILVEATCHTTAKSLLDDMAEELKIPLPKSLHGKLKGVARYLKDADKIILVDEAEHLPLKALEDLRRIHDFSRTPIVLCGTEILLKNLMGRNKELKQLYSRICGKWVMKGLNEKECKECFGRYIYKWSKGNFRTSAKLSKRAKRLADIKDCEVDEKIVSLATEMIVL